MRDPQQDTDDREFCETCKAEMFLSDYVAGQEMTFICQNPNCADFGIELFYSKYSCYEKY